MDLDAAKKLIKQYIPGHTTFERQAKVAERYYRVDNDIMYCKKKMPVIITLCVRQTTIYHIAFIISS